MRSRTAIWIASWLLVGLMGLAVPAAAPAEHSKLELISTGTGPEGNGTGRDPVQVSQDGRRVLFQSWDDLAPGDTDDCTDPEFPEDVAGCEDTYERFGGMTSLVTTGPTDPQGRFPHHILGASPDFERVLFESYAGLVAEDTNSHWDLYGRVNGSTTLLSPSWPPLSGETWFAVVNISRDGQRAFLATPNRLVPEDTDDCTDFYELSSGTFKLMTPNVALIGPFDCADLIKFFTSADGSHFFWKTSAKATSEDTDSSQDIYETFNGQVRLVSTGPADTAEGGSLRSGSAVSADGSKVVFTTDEKLVEEDTDAESDVYERSNGETHLVAPPVEGDQSPPFGFTAMSTDGHRVIGMTDVRLVPEDIDAQTDLYAIVDGSAELLSLGTSGGNGDFTVQSTGGTDDINVWPLWSRNIPTFMSQDGRVVTFATWEQLVPADTDQEDDLYANVDGVVRLISTGTNDVGQSFDADIWRSQVVSPDGSRIFFHDSEPFTQEDNDTQVDVYEWHAGSTTVVPHGVPTPDPVYLADNYTPMLVDDGSRVFIATETPLTADDTGDTDDLYDIYGVAVNGDPDCDAVSAKPPRMWPATGEMVAVVLSGATDPDGDPVSIGITGVTQDEPVGVDADAVLKPGRRKAVRLRAERLPARDGRVYRVAFEATDGNGGSCEGTVPVSVRSKRHIPAQDSAPLSWNSVR